MSTSTSATTQEHESGSSPQLPTASGKGATDKADKKKLKLLKQALKDERVAKASIEKELESAVQRIEQLNKVCTEKVSADV